MSDATLGEALAGGAGPHRRARCARAAVPRDRARRRVRDRASRSAAAARRAGSTTTTLVERRAQGEPVAYLTGEREFYGRLFQGHARGADSAPGDRASRRSRARAHPAGRPRRGCSISAPAAAASRSRSRASAHSAKILALDQSLDALARRPAERRRPRSVGNVAFLQSDWFSALRERAFRRDRRQSAVRRERRPAPRPRATCASSRARRSTAAPTASTRSGTSSQAREEHLTPGGWLLFEHGHDQGERARLLLHGAGLRGDLHRARSRRHRPRVRRPIDASSCRLQ